MVYELNLNSKPDLDCFKQMVQATARLAKAGLFFNAEPIASDQLGSRSGVDVFNWLWTKNANTKSLSKTLTGYIQQQFAKASLGSLHASAPYCGRTSRTIWEHATCQASH